MKIWKKIKASKKYKKLRKKIMKSEILTNVMVFLKTLLMKKKKKEKFNKLIAQHYPEINQSEFKKFWERFRVCKDEFRYGMRSDNNYCFDFAHKTEEEKKEFVGTREKTDSIRKLIKKYPESDWNFRDKFDSYQKLAKFYKRDIIKVNSSFDKEKFVEFASKHDDFFVKENRGALGSGAYAIHMKKEERTIDEIFNQVLETAPCIVEERIVQHPAMAAFHPSSVNSIRFVTYWNENDELMRLYSNIRIGQGGSIVDNASAGGIIASVDLETGEITTPGYGENNVVAYDNHPDTDYPIKGTFIPAWDELLAMIDELAEITKDRWYIGWDFAYSNRGWMMIEANDNPGIVGPQMSFQKGVRSLFTETVKKRIKGK